MIDANSQFFAILTNVGMAKQANADALGIPWLITQMGVGDANGTEPIPSVTQTKLINEWRRKPLNQLKIDPVNPAVIIAEQIIPADEGGKWIREIGLYDADGDLVAVANCAPSFKPLLSQGSGRTQIVRMSFIVTSTGNIQLKIDPAIVLASRAYVDAAILEVLPKNKTPGQYTRVKVNDRGVFVSGDNPETLAGMGIKDTYTKTEIEAMIAQASALPVGATVAFPLDKVAPGFLELDGSVKSIAVYPDLAAFLGTAFNKGDEGAGNFRLPESRGEFLRGWDHGRGVDAGRLIGSWQADEFKSHVHQIDAPANPTGFGQDKVARGSRTDSNGTPMTTATGGIETRPRNLAVIWCIKAWNAPINQGNVDIAALAAIVDQLRINGAVVGTARNLRMDIPVASSSAAITATELVLADASGRKITLNNFNKPINLAAAVKGVGAMDVGAAPISGYVALYGVYNEATKVSGVIAVNTTAVMAPETYGGTNMTAGFGFSALISVYPTNATGQFIAGLQEGRKISFAPVEVVRTTAATTGLTISVAAVVPLNAQRIGGGISCGASGGSASWVYVSLCCSSAGLGVVPFSTITSMGSLMAQGFSGMDLQTRQKIYYTLAFGTGALLAVAISSYEF